METPTLLLKLIQHLVPQKAGMKRSVSQGDSGFTFLELLVVILMIGVLATIAAPGWLAFTQQRRVTAANESIFRALQEAQSQAKKTKRSYSVSLRTENGVPQIAVYPTKQRDGENNTDVSGDIGWRNLGQDLEIKSGQIMVGTNLNDENQKQANINYSLQATNKITFDYLGALPPTTNSTNLPLTIVVAAPKANGQANESMLRCVKVTTLLGTLVTERKGNCLAND